MVYIIIIVYYFEIFVGYRVVVMVNIKFVCFFFLGGGGGFGNVEVFKNV